MIAELEAERDRLDQAILALERLAAGKRRGRPPKWLAAQAAERASNSDEPRDSKPKPQP